MANEGAIYGKSPPEFYANRWRWPDFDLRMGPSQPHGSDNDSKTDHAGVKKDFPRAPPVGAGGPVVMPPSPRGLYKAGNARDKKRRYRTDK